MDGICVFFFSLVEGQEPRGEREGSPYTFRHVGAGTQVVTVVVAVGFTRMAVVHWFVPVQGALLPHPSCVVGTETIEVCG